MCGGIQHPGEGEEGRAAALLSAGIAAAQREKRGFRSALLKKLTNLIFKCQFSLFFFHLSLKSKVRWSVPVTELYNPWSE